ncbi:MAG: hypothetical protein HXN58_02960 [Prevotella pallens]|uniref:hypothetical protein n=1 Tax=Prevotella pallens TaxID=60133 RepID=UPI001CAE9ED0|nr:hypothetical protein [Prevotella pallens]MBF1442677.1 hypothetical protein [Prevotella pallens]
MNTDVTKQKYLRPAIAVFDIMEDKFLLATSPNVRPGGGGNPSGSVTIEDATPVVGVDGDELFG